MYKFEQFNCEKWRGEIYIIPTIRVVKDHPVYARGNFSVELHFLCFHIRWQWMERRD